jgi:hypothetical protein
MQPIRGFSCVVAAPVSDAQVSAAPADQLRIAQSLDVRPASAMLARYRTLCCRACLWVPNIGWGLRKPAQSQPVLAVLTECRHRWR